MAPNWNAPHSPGSVDDEHTSLCAGKPEFIERCIGGGGGGGFKAPPFLSKTKLRGGGCLYGPAMQAAI